MTNRRSFLRQAAAGIIGLGATQELFASPAAAADAPAWSGPIGLELYTVRHQLARNPLATLRAVAAAGYQLVEGDIVNVPAAFPDYLRQSGLKMISTLVMQPEPGSVAQWQPLIEKAARHHLQYFVTMNVGVHDAEGWKRISDSYNQAGKLAHQHGMTFCYHNHITEFIPTQGTTGYAVMQKNTDPNLVKFEMDVFWMTYARQDPIAWFKRAPGRYPLLHIKDMKKQVPAAYNPQKFPQGFNPFTEVGRGRIDWASIFDHAKLAGTQNIFVEQDQTGSLTPEQAIRISYNYLRHLKLPQQAELPMRRIRPIHGC